MTRFTCCLVTLAALLAQLPVHAEESLQRLGEQIYRSGIGSGGKPVSAVVHNDVNLPPQAAACSNCHRRSGYGISEGGSRSLNLTSTALFAPSSKPPVRRAYDDRTLVRAIAGGIAADGRVLHETMPQYELNNDEARALVHYLRRLGAETPPGVSDSELVVATIVVDDAPSQEREAVLSVMNRYVELKNSESRREPQRAAASSRHFYGRNRQRAHRTWKLVVWRLSGPQQTWSDQLAALNEDQQPFAIVSGTSGGRGKPLHDFCEAEEIPCILPLDAGSAEADDDFYSLYFSSGKLLEARVTANHLGSSGLDPQSRVLVAHNGKESDAEAVDMLQSALADVGFKNVGRTRLKQGKKISHRKWRSLFKREKPAVLIAWIDANSVANIATENLTANFLPQRIYTAHSYTDWQGKPPVFSAFADRLRHVYPYSLPTPGLAQFPRESIWLKQHGLEDLDAASASRVLFACRVLGMGLADIQTNFSREYLLEALEHALDGTQLHSLYPRTSLGPNQRLLVRGAYIVGLEHAAEGRFSSPVWVQP